MSGPIFFQSTSPLSFSWFLAYKIKKLRLFGGEFVKAKGEVPLGGKKKILLGKKILKKKEGNIGR